MEPVGMTGLESIVYVVHDLDRSRHFYIEKLDFAEVGRSTPELEEAEGQRTVVFSAGECRVICVKPLRDDSWAARWMLKHPDGVAELRFGVEDADRALALLESRGATPIEDVRRESGIAHFAITTPFQITWRFVERGPDSAPLYPGIALTEHVPTHNRIGFGQFDHITSNFETLSPALLWMQHVMGFERYWDITFHTIDIDPTRESGSGLKSVVMWDPHSGVKFANNEPLRPHFEDSQINLFIEDLRANGVQHAAMTVSDILPAVTQLRERGISFMPTPAAYYDMLPQRIRDVGIMRIDEDIEDLRRLEILIDGKEEHSYLLQIFMQESAGLYGEREAGPFFYEVIQRKGDRGFGGGNFRALFESIERLQRSAGRV
ncbi:MAG: 4-hydroxyphenylpyruvate dioxygenase [Myxococcota bacterium]|jgi:4-hydroxyphenylpyruvate dioxygenase